MRTDTYNRRAEHTSLGTTHGEQPPYAFGENDTGGFSRIFGSLPLVCGLTTVIGVALSLVSAACLLYAPDPVALLPVASRLSVCLASLLGGILAARKIPAAPLAGGLASGSVMALILTVAGLCLGEGSMWAWMTRLGSLPLHLVGAYLARPRARAAAHTAHTAGRHHTR